MSKEYGAETYDVRCTENFIFATRVYSGDRVVQPGISLTESRIAFSSESLWIEYWWPVKLGLETSRVTVGSPNYGLTQNQAFRSYGSWWHTVARLLLLVYVHTYCTVVIRRYFSPLCCSFFIRPLTYIWAGSCPVAIAKISMDCLHVYRIPP